MPGSRGSRWRASSCRWWGRISSTAACGVRRGGDAAGDRARRVRDRRMALLRWLLASAVLLAPGRGLGAQTGRVAEYRVKAVFLFNFAQFVDWPAAALDRK